MSIHYSIYTYICTHTCVYDYTHKEILFSWDKWKAHTFSFVHVRISKTPEEQILFQCIDAAQTAVLFVTPSLTTNLRLWKTKGLKATGFWNAFSRRAIYGGIRNQPTIYI